MRFEEVALVQELDLTALNDNAQVAKQIIPEPARMIAYIKHGTLSANHLKARQVQSLVEDSELRPSGILGQIFEKRQVGWLSLQLRQTVNRFTTTNFSVNT